MRVLVVLDRADNKPAEGLADGRVVGVVSGEVALDALVELVGGQLVLEPLPHPPLHVREPAAGRGGDEVGRVLVWVVLPGGVPPVVRRVSGKECCCPHGEVEI